MSKQNALCHENLLKTTMEEAVRKKIWRGSLRKSVAPGIEGVGYQYY